eukprot:ANDGO_08301.mRNA.1 Physarolisin
MRENRYRCSVLFAAVALLVVLGAIGSATASDGVVNRVQIATEHPASLHYENHAETRSLWMHRIETLDTDSAMVEITIGIPHKQSSLDWLERRFNEVSNPDLPTYGAFETFDSIRQQMIPDDSHGAVILGFLAEHTAVVSENRFQYTYMKDHLKVSMLGSEVRRVFGVAELARMDDGLIRALQQPTLPGHVASHVQFVVGLGSFYHMRKAGKQNKKASLSLSSLFNQFSIPSPSSPSSSSSASVGSLQAVSGMFQMIAGPASVFVGVPVLCPNGQYGAYQPVGQYCSDQGTALLTSVEIGLYYTLNFWTNVSANSYPFFAETFQMRDFQNGLATDYTTAILMRQVDALDGQQVTGFVRLLFSDGSVVKMTAAAAVVPSRLATIEDLRTLYDIPPGMSAVSCTRGGVAVIEFNNGGYNPSDLLSFLNLDGMPSPASCAGVVVLGFNPGATAECSACGEAALDIQVAAAVARGVSVAFYLNSTDASFQSFVSYFLSVPTWSVQPLVHSISWGAPEGYWSQSMITSMDTQMQILGTSGISVLASSGDNGVLDSTTPNSVCSCSSYCVNYPASSMYATSVGATRFSSGSTPMCASLNPLSGSNVFYGSHLASDTSSSSTPFMCSSVGEVVCSTLGGAALISSGGGFSQLYAAPSYAAAMTNAYYAMFSPREGGLSAGGRGVPDISAIGHNYPVVLQGNWGIYDGTSASSPLVAAMVALINDRLLADGYSGMGPLNPFLYGVATKYPEAYRDVVMGNNGCAEMQSSGMSCCAGFNAAPGWDASTGIGTPRFQSLMSAAVAVKQGGLSRAPAWLSQGIQGIQGTKGQQGSKADADDSLRTAQAALVLVIIMMIITAGLAVYVFLLSRKMPSAESLRPTTAQMSGESTVSYSKF